MAASGSYPEFGPLVTGLDADILETGAQREELTQRIPAQVILLHQLFDVLGCRTARPVSYIPPPAISGTTDSILALVPNSRIGNRSVR